MPHLFTGTSVEDVIRKSIGRSNQPVDPLQTKGDFQLYAPALFAWSHWITIFALFGITGPDSRQNVTDVLVSFDNDKSGGTLAFGVEIIGGDHRVTANGPGLAIVTITGNVTAELRFRARSFTTPQNVSINVSFTTRKTG